MEKYLKALVERYFGDGCTIKVYTGDDGRVNIDFDHKESEYWVYGVGDTIEEAFVNFVIEFIEFLEFDC